MKYFDTKWFRRRKYSGWGITPITWQGWVFVIVLVAPLAIISSYFKPNLTIGDPIFIIFGLYLAFVVVIAMSIMASIKQDEREKIHEAIADRNALWIMTFVLALGAISETVSPDVVRSIFPINLFIIGALISAWIAKLITAIYLDHKD